MIIGKKSNKISSKKKEEAEKMKKVKNLVIALFLAFTFIVADLAAAPVTAQAASTLKFAKSITLMREPSGFLSSAPAIGGISL